MQHYVAQRALLMIPTFLLLSLLVFSLLRFIPGDVVTMLSEELPYVDTMEEMRRELGLDKSFFRQYFEWMEGLFTGDLGQSLWSKRPVSGELAWRWPVTLELALLSIVVNLLVGIPVGIVAAVRQDKWMDYVLRSIAILAIAAPTFWIGTLVVTLPSMWWHWTPPLEYTPFQDDPLANLKVLIIPALILGFFLQGRTVRLLRAMMLEVMRQDYIRTAWAKGLKEQTVIYRHVLRNAMIPVVTVIGLEIPFLLSGTVVIEEIFNLPGMGRYMLDVLERRDYVPVQSVVLAFAVIVMVTNLLVDLTYSWLDPRIRYR